MPHYKLIISELTVCPDVWSFDMEEGHVARRQTRLDDQKNMVIYINDDTPASLTSRLCP